MSMLRHAQESITQPGMEAKALNEHSLIFLELVTRKILSRILQRKVAIFYSPVKKVELTALALSSTLSLEKEIVDCLPLEWLTSLEADLLDDSRDFVEDRFQSFSVMYPDTFMIFITHQNSISAYAGVPLARVQNCAFFSREFEIGGHEPFKKRRSH